MAALFFGLILLCALEDSRHEAVSVPLLAALLSSALLSSTMLSSAATPELRTSLGMASGAALVAVPFHRAAVRGAAGPADTAGALAVGVRYGASAAVIVLAVACLSGMIGFLVLHGLRMPPRRMPFFPYLAIATILTGAAS